MTRAVTTPAAPPSAWTSRAASSSGSEGASNEAIAPAI